MRLLAAITTLLIAPWVISPARAQDRWHELADKAHKLTSTAAGLEWEQKMLPVHNAFWASIIEKCAPAARAAGVIDFQAVAVISADGTVSEYLLNSQAPSLQCFSSQMVGRQYPAPPQAPFYEYYITSLIGED